MVAVTFGGARGATAAVETKSGKKRKSYLRRVYDAICEAQMKRAERELATYRHLLPPDFKLDPMNWAARDGKEPFGGW